MNGGQKLKVFGAIATLIGLAANVLSAWVSSEQIKDAVKEELDKRMDMQEFVQNERSNDD